MALIAIGGTYAGFPLFDPLGGMVVSCMILKSGASMMSQSSQELLDKSISESELNEIKTIIASVKVKIEKKKNLFITHYACIYIIGKGTRFIRLLFNSRT